MTNVTVFAPLSGRLIPLAQVPDPVFASGKMGQGFAISDTLGGEVMAPVSGRVVMVANTGHAIGVETEDGIQVLVHLGIDTVELDGAPFKVRVAKGDSVSAGQVLATQDNDVILKAKKDPTCVVIITNSRKLASFTPKTGSVAAGDAAAQAELLLDDTAAAPVAATTTKTASSSKDSELTGFDALAEKIITGVGGKENISHVTHCITRLRFYLRDQSEADDTYVRNLDGIIDVVKAGGQYQVVIGPDVNDVFEATERQLGVDGDSTPEPSRNNESRPDSALGWLKYGFSQLIGVITGSMIPVIGLLAASGIIKGILSLLLTFDVITEDTNTFQLINAMSDAVFFFLPIFVGFTAARRLGADPITVAIIGGVLCYPALVEMSKGEGTSAVLGMPINSDFFGIPFHMASYSYSIFPIIVAAWLASIIEPHLKRWVPNVVRMIFVPLIEVVVVSLAILLFLGPIVMFISTGVANAIQGLYDLSPTISGFIIGGFYQSLVIFGLHWAVIPLVAQDIATTGNSSLNAIISATMVAQGGAVMAVLFKTKADKLKGLAGPATISAFCGITEPAMYGVNLKYGRIFVMASIGGAVGGLITGLMNVNMWGFTGSLVGFTSFINPQGLDSSFWGFLIASGAAIVVSFALTWMFGFEDSDIENERTVKKVRLGNREPVERTGTE